MGVTYRRRRARGESQLGSFVLVGVFLCVLGIMVWGIHEKERERTDTRKALELRVEYGSLANDVMRLPEDHPDRPKMERRLRDVAIEHNMILNRHPTWNHKPLGPYAETR